VKTADTRRLTQLGQKSEIPVSPEEAEIQTFEWRGSAVSVRFTCPEFSSICPLTGQPDFARLVIDYVPDRRMIESKSLKLFLHSFRNEGAFHEAVVDLIGSRLFEASKPHWMRIGGFFYPRGGIPLDIFCLRGEVPKGIFIPVLDQMPYHGR
jgi:7-cyano-7-deazaguanine reductase